MQISSRFTIAIHIFTCVEVFKENYSVTSDFLSGSINVNPVVIRRILQQLTSAGLIEVKRGKGGGITVKKPLDKISFYDIYKAVECIDNGELFHFHDNPNPECPVGRNIHTILDGELSDIQTAMENKMRQKTIAKVIKSAKKRIEDEKQK